MEITKNQYEYALRRIEGLLPLVKDDTSISDPKELAKELGISPSRVSEYIKGKSEPTLGIARALCTVLGIAPSAILGL